MLRCGLTLLPEGACCGSTAHPVRHIEVPALATTCKNDCQIWPQCALAIFVTGNISSAAVAGPSVRSGVMLPHQRCA